MLLLTKIAFKLGCSHILNWGWWLSRVSFYIKHGKDMMAHSLSDMENYFSELEDFITLSDNDKVHLFHSSMLEILILKVNFIIRSTQYSQNLNKV